MPNNSSQTRSYTVNGFAHASRAADVVAALDSNLTLGLSTTEIDERRDTFGFNELPKDRQQSYAALVLRQFKSPLIYLLLVAALMASLLGNLGDASVILVVVIINAAIGAVQEGRAARSMAELQRLSAVSARVVRGGIEQVVNARDLVPGDILLLSTGDAIGSDARIVECAALQCAEAALTGESVPVVKESGTLASETILADRTNMVFSGTHVTAGRARAIVTATGLSTEIGKIARLTATTREAPTPLETRIAQYGRNLVVAALIVFVLVVTLGALRGLQFIDIFMVAISQVVSMVPEGLPVAMTIALAVGMQRMARRGAIVRRLAAVETLGSTSIICTDKTGTLTRNEMMVSTVWLPDERTFEISGNGYAPAGDIKLDGFPFVPDLALRKAMEAAALCNDSKLIAPDAADSRWRVLGDPTEGALLSLAMKGGIDVDVLRKDWPRWGELPFDPSTKMMATAHVGPHAEQQVFIKGAPEVLVRFCGRNDKSDLRISVDDPQQQIMLEAADRMAHRGLRVLAIATVENSLLESGKTMESLAGKATLLALIGEIDPPRNEVKQAVSTCQKAGIRPVMVTGDHKGTGLVIAKALNIATERDHAVSGSELETMPEQDLRDSLDRIAVFARVHPAQKLRIVEAFQSRGDVCAMTGDGVNDAPALARADVGVAMGLSGTEVAKSAADIVITDDNFATIVNAVEEGRLVYQNIKKVILYLFATSIAEVAILLLALLLGYPLPLAAVQILWINLVTEGTVTVNLIMEPAEGDEMKRKPVPLSEPLLGKVLLRRIAIMTPTMALSTFLFFVWRLTTDTPFALIQTETFTLLAASQWFNVLNCESERQSALRLGLMRNPWLLGGLALGIILQLLVIYVPQLNTLFHTTPIPIADFLIVCAIASTVLWVEEIRKLISRRLFPIAV